MKISRYLCLHIKITAEGLLFAIYAPEIYEMFVYKHTETTEKVKNLPA